MLLTLTWRLSDWLSWADKLRPRNLQFRCSLSHSPEWNARKCLRVFTWAHFTETWQLQNFGNRYFHLSLLALWQHSQWHGRHHAIKGPAKGFREEPPRGIIIIIGSWRCWIGYNFLLCKWMMVRVKCRPQETGAEFIWHSNSGGSSPWSIHCLLSRLSQRKYSQQIIQ